MSFVQKTKKLVESMSLWMKIRRPAQMPFANQGSGISGIMQAFGQGDLASRDTRTGIFIAGADGVEFVTKSSWKPAGQQAGPRGTAIGGGDIGLSTADTAFREPINPWRGDLRIALTAEFTVAQIIGDEQHDIGLILRSRVGPPAGRLGRHEAQYAEAKGVGQPWPLSFFAHHVFLAALRLGSPHGTRPSLAKRRIPHVSSQPRSNPCATPSIPSMFVVKENHCVGTVTCTMIT